MNAIPESLLLCTILIQPRINTDSTDIDRYRTTDKYIYICIAINKFKNEWVNWFLHGSTYDTGDSENIVKPVQSYKDNIFLSSILYKFGTSNGSLMGMYMVLKMFFL